MFQWLSRLVHKRYDPSNWEAHLPVEQLQAIYDGQGWSGPEGEWRRRNVTDLMARLRGLAAEQERPVGLLDVACFTGEYWGRLREVRELAGRVRYTGVDVTPSYVKQAAERWRADSTARFVCGSALGLPFADRSFDVVFNSGMLIHVDDVPGCIAELIRVARRLVLVETTIDPALTRDYAEKGASGVHFLDRVYRRGYIQDTLRRSTEIVTEVDTPYRRYQSVLFIAAPRQRG